MSSIIKVDTVQDQDGNNIINENANTITIGASGDTITIPSGATLANNGTATGFGLTTQSVQTTGFTAVKGNLYPCDTTSTAFTVTLPASASVGDQIQIVDYAGTFATNNLTINPNGLKIQTDTGNRIIATNRIALTFTYIDSTQGWLLSSGYKEEADGFYVAPYDIDFLVVAGGGGGGGGSQPGGGGAGGFRTSTQTSIPGGTAITVIVGDGGTGATGFGVDGNNATQGSDSSISGSGLTTITSAGGGKGSSQAVGGDGGSGGGGSRAGRAGGSGNTPSTSPSQGNNGGSGAEGAPQYGAGGGGGAGAVGANGSTSAGGNGGNGTASSITGSSVTYSGGGGGGTLNTTGGSGGTGGGGNSPASGTSGVAGTANTGGGGGAGTESTGGAGGKGVVILSVPDANYSGTTTGSPTVDVNAGGTGKTVLTFTGSGSYTS